MSSKNNMPPISKTVVTANHHDPIEDVLRTMKDNKVSCVLIKNDNDTLVGILTERDIVKKIALLDVNDKLDRRVNTIMSRPILFIREGHLIHDIKVLLQKHKIRHFPVIKDHNEPTLIGIVTLTDITKFLLGAG